MALIEDQHSHFKHYCRICKKGFGCGRALGGHMRAHGIGDDTAHIDDDDDDHASDWEAAAGPNAPPPPTTNKRMYALRTNPNRFKNCRSCENCGKEFSSWKSFLEHGKCTSDDDEEDDEGDDDSLLSSPGSDADDGLIQRRGGGSGNWSKRKRSFRAKVFGSSHCPSSEEEDLANCLMMLSNATVDAFIVEPEESCASASKDEIQRNYLPLNFVSNNNTNNNNNDYTTIVTANRDKAKGVVTKGMFECKACKKVFNSHQALGGHRASHKKVKGCFAAKIDHLKDNNNNNNNNNNIDDQDHDVITHEEFFPTKSMSTMQFDHGTIGVGATSSKRKSKIHECSICHRVFSSGQALGGHKRCHWITSNSLAETSSLPKFNHHHHQFHEQQGPNNNNNLFKNPTVDQTLDLTLDLNLPAPGIDHHNPHKRNTTNIISGQVSTEIFLQPLVGVKHEKQISRSQDHDNSDNNNVTINHKDENCDESLKNMVLDDEADSKVKLAKLSELKDMKMINEGSSPWLQMGIGSTTDQVGDDPEKL
ncbi:zinc finger protein ZAT9-like [Carica papaya]|uniref:zinc finger protein ZAT9-like n=1 Tax=Carica papaya TaxID=3649 RepID=UPI000B8CD1BF|nr:zinc finger protein ZAT9-like [Carica papaya]